MNSLQTAFNSLTTTDLGRRLGFFGSCVRFNLMERESRVAKVAVAALNLLAMVAIVKYGQIHLFCRDLTYLTKVGVESIFECALKGDFIQTTLLVALVPMPILFFALPFAMVCLSFAEEYRRQTEDSTLRRLLFPEAGDLSQVLSESREDYKRFLTNRTNLDVFPDLYNLYTKPDYDLNRPLPGDFTQRITVVTDKKLLYPSQDLNVFIKVKDKTTSETFVLKLFRWEKKGLCDWCVLSDQADVSLFKKNWMSFEEVQLDLKKLINGSTSWALAD